MDQRTAWGDTLVSAYIYVEGGGSGEHSKELDIRCRKGFHTLLEKSGFRGRMPRLVPSGGRVEVYDRFIIAHSTMQGTYVAMWIDSEEPMVNIEAAWEHLQTVKTVPQWQKPAGARDHQVLFMTTCMEAWIVADVAALREHYGSDLQDSALPPLHLLERRDRHDIQAKLIHATRNCSNAYAKGKRSFEVLEKLTPAILEQHLPSFVRICRILNEKL
jgi:hypothetical protein